MLSREAPDNRGISPPLHEYRLRREVGSQGFPERDAGVGTETGNEPPNNLSIIRYVRYSLYGCPHGNGISRWKPM